MSLQSKLESGKFVITCEVGPLKGTDIAEVEENATLLKDRVDAANITDQQSSVMRLGSLTTAYIVLRKGLEPIYQCVCRDRNRIALQSDLLSAAVLGIKNVLSITGDLPQLGDHPEAKAVYDLDSVTLLQAIKRLNEGYDINGNELQGKPSFFPGAVVKVDSDTEASLELQIAKLEKKVAAGARFVQTQAVFDVPRFERWMAGVRDLGLHERVRIIAGVLPVRSVRALEYMRDEVSGMMIPEETVARMRAAEDPAEEGVRIACELVERLRAVPGVAGIHLMPVMWEKITPRIVEEAGLGEGSRTP